MKKCLIFAGAGKAEKEYLSWASKKSAVYDRAINFYDRTDEEMIEKKNELGLEYAFNNKGMIFDNFADMYDEFKDYEYISITDGDLDISREAFDEVFQRCLDNNYSAAQLSRTDSGFGHFKSHFVSLDKDVVTDTNFIEMGFMIIRKDLMKLLIDKWFEFNLEYSTGIDIILSNVAYHNNMLPFKIFHKYKFYNPTVNDKNGVREINKAGGTPSVRIQGLNKLFTKNMKWFKFWVNFEHNGVKFRR